MTTIAEAVESGKASRQVEIAVIDGDIHNAVASEKVLMKYIPDPWLKHYETVGRRGYSGSGYARAVPHAARLDAWPPSGLPPGADLDFMRQQLLDEWDLEYGILNCLNGVGSESNQDFGAALAQAVNDWQVAEWIEPEPRLKASLILPYESADLAIAEIERIGCHPGFVQILFMCRTREPMGHRKYWPVYEAAVRHQLPVGVHFGGAGGGPITGAGWPSHYIEDHGGMPQAFQAQVTSLALSGVFEQIPDLKFVWIEGGFGWLPPVMWRLDRMWTQYGDEMPAVKRRPSEYIRTHMWLTTQPVEEPPEPAYFGQLLDHLDMDDRLMFATDYPHWDFDAPNRVFPINLTSERKEKIMAGNARALYKL